MPSWPAALQTAPEVVRGESVASDGGGALPFAPSARRRREAVAPSLASDANAATGAKSMPDTIDSAATVHQGSVGGRGRV